MASNAGTQDTSTPETASDDTEFPSPLDMLFAAKDELRELLEDNIRETDSSACPLWKTVPLTSRKGEVNMYTKLWQEEFLTDLTLVVGPDQIPIKVHRIVLVAHFEFFRSMFSSRLKESSLTEVHLPFVGPEDLRSLLKYAYSGKVNLNKENMFKMAVMANYFGCENLLDICCESFKKYIDIRNCTRFLEVAFHWNISQLQKNSILFIVEYLHEVNKDDISTLPVDVLLKIIEHPAAQMSVSDAESEKQMFHLIWDKIKSSPEETKTELIESGPPA